MQPKRPRINPLILALALAAVLMVWSVMGSGSGSTSGSTMSYSTVVHYFEHNQVTAFTLDRNTSVITLNLKEGDLPLPDVSSTQSTVQSTGGLLSGMFSSSSESTGAVQEDDGTVTVRYKLPYAYVFIENVDKYIESYDAANPDAPMTYDYTSLKETIPWMEIIFYLGNAGKGLQAGKLLQQLTPDGKLYMAEKALQNLNSKLRSRKSPGRRLHRTPRTPRTCCCRRNSRNSRRCSSSRTC